MECALASHLAVPSSTSPAASVMPLPCTSTAAWGSPARRVSIRRWDVRKGGAISTGVVAIDGTKLKASASPEENLDYRQIAREIIGLLGEALELADGLGLSRETTWDVLDGTPLAGQAERRRSAVESGDYPLRFALALARKDAELVAEAATAAGLELPLAGAARDWFAKAEAEGFGERDYSEVLARIIARAEH